MEQTKKQEGQKATQKNKKSQPNAKKIITIISIILAIILSFTGGYFSRYIFEPKEVNLTSDIIRIIQNFGYVVDEDGNARDLTADDYANAITNGLLDEYGKYYTKEEYEEITQQRKGNRTGFGINISVDDSSPPYILQTIGNSPADKGGLKKDDLILSLTKEGGQKTAISTTGDLSKFFANCGEEKVDFEVLRAGETITISIKKASYKTTYVQYFDNQKKASIIIEDGDYSIGEDVDEKIEILDDDMALIVLTSFEGDASKQLEYLLNYMKSQGKDKLIFDLRDNGGGYMDVLEEIAGQFIYNDGKKTLIAQSQNKTKKDNFYATKTKKHAFIKEISIIANDNTASASECLIGAMLYYKEKFCLENLVIEKNQSGIARTFGKGIMQQTYLLQDGGAFKLTTALVYQPDLKTCIHKKGIIALEENAVEKGTPAIERAVLCLR